MQLSTEDQPAVRALNRLRANPDFQEYQAWLGRNLAAMREKNDTMTGDPLKWSQGKCQAVQKILEAPALARKIIESAR